VICSLIHEQKKRIVDDCIVTFTGKSDGRQWVRLDVPLRRMWRTEPSNRRKKRSVERKKVSSAQ